MIESKHTKGKWAVAKSGSGYTCVWVGASKICTVDEFPHEGSEANAHLIAAAPTMLDELVRLYEKYKEPETLIAINSAIKL